MRREVAARTTTRGRRHRRPRAVPGRGSGPHGQAPPAALTGSAAPPGAAPPAGGGPGISAAAAPHPQSRRAARLALAVPLPAPPPAAPRRRPPRRTAMIVESSRDAAPDGGDGSALSSPINLAYFYGASPHSSEGSCSPAHSSAPGSPGSDSDLSVSSRGGGRRDPRGGPRPTLQVEQHMGGGKQHRGPFQGVRVKNSVKELLLHFRSSKQMSSGPATEENKAQGGLVNYEPYTELKNILGHSGKRKAPELLSDGPSFKRQANVHPHLLTPPQTPTSMDSMEETHKSDPKHESSSDLLQNIINIKNESSPISLNTVQVSWLHSVSSHGSPAEQYQDSPGTQAFSPSQKYQAFQDHTSQHMLDPPQHYQFPASQSQDLSQSYPSDASLDYRPFVASDQSPAYQQNTFESHELPYCPSQSFSSLLNDSEGSDSISAPLQPLSSAHPQTEAAPHAPNFSLLSSNLCGSLERSVSLATLNVSLPDQNVARSTTQLGKSFFQWQVEQEENKLANISQDQFLAKDADGDTFLHIAVAQGRRALSYVLARKMAALHMLDIKEHNGQSAFQVAVAANQHLIVQDLVSLGAQVNTTDCWGRTPLHVCAEKGHAQVLQAIQKGAMGSNQYVDLEATNYDGLTALHCAVLAHNAVLHELQNCQPPHSPEVQELLLRNKSLVETIKILIQMGASVEAKDRKSGRSALHLAAEEANLELIRLFLELPNYLSFVNAKAYNGNTALHVAASLQYRVSQLDAVRLLMRKGADPSARNLENEQPVHLVPDGLVGEQIRRILKGKAIQQRVSPF